MAEDGDPTTVEWVAPPGGARFRVVELRDGPCIGVGPVSSVPEPSRRALDRMGFETSTALDMFVRRDPPTFRLSEARDAFPGTVVVDVPYAETRTTSFLGWDTVTGRTDDPGVSPIQVPYVPLSRVGEPTGMIPTALAGPTSRALARLAARVGDVDAYVVDRLGWDPTDLPSRLSPEQVDAVALGVDAALGGRSPVIADATGFGKGRTLASIILAIMREGGEVVFVTEKASLFSDLWRDLADVGCAAAVGVPGVVNADTGVRDMAAPGQPTIHPSLSADETASLMASGDAPARLTMLTYSQVSQAGSPKAEWFARMARGRYLVLDECQNSSGDSNQAAAVAAAEEGAIATVRASATFVPRPDRMASQSGLLPPSMRGRDLAGVLGAGGRELAEWIAQSLAEDGLYIRREHDMTDYVLDLVVDEEGRDRARRVCDAVAPVLRAAREVAEATAKVCEERSDKGSSWTTAAFGSRLAAFSDLLSAVLLAPAAGRRAADALDDGEKPVVAFESTTEALLREIAGTGDGGSGDDAPSPDLRGVLEVMVERCRTASVRVGRKDPVRKVVDDPRVERALARARAALVDLPSVPTSPIDVVRDVLAARGRSSDEVSGRSWRVRDGAVVPHEGVDRVGAVSRFNSGETDGLILTSAGSTGLSVHSDPRFADHRPRRFIGAQPCRNVLSWAQMLGRTNRRGQVHRPTQEVLHTGMPFQVRHVAAVNRRMADLMAVTTGSSRDVARLDVPDTMDVLGEDCARTVIQDHPEIAARMGLRVRHEAEPSSLEHVNRLYLYLPLVSVDEQETMVEAMTSLYLERADDLRQRSIPVSGGRELGDGWRRTASAPFLPEDPSDGPTFGRAVEVVTYERSRRAGGLTTDTVRSMIARSAEYVPTVAAAAVRAVRPNRLREALGKAHRSVEDALRAERPNAVQVLDERLERLVRLVESVRPGAGIVVTSADGPVRGVVVSIRAPNDESVRHRPGEWKVGVAVPGDDAPRRFTMAGLMRDDGFRALEPGGTERVLSSFDAPPGTERRHVLAGNPIRARIALLDVPWARRATLTTVEGETLVGMEVPEARLPELSSLPRRTTDAGVAGDALAAGAVVETDRTDPDRRLVLEMGARGLVVSMNGRAAKRFVHHPAAAHADEPMGTSRRRTCAVPDDDVGAFLEALSDAGEAFYFAPYATPGPDAPAPAP